MPIRRFEYLFDGDTEIGVRVHGGTIAGYHEFLYEDVPGQGWPQSRLDAAQAFVQDNLDVAVPLTDLDDSNPDKTTDPALTWKFWDGQGNIVYRELILEPLSWDGSHLTVSITRAR